MPGGSRVDLLRPHYAPQAPASLRDGNYLGQGVDVHIRLVPATSHVAITARTFVLLRMRLTRGPDLTDASLASEAAVRRSAFLGDSRSTNMAVQSRSMICCNSSRDLKRIGTSEFGETQSSGTNRSAHGQYRDAYWNVRSRTWKTILSLRKSLRWKLSEQTSGKGLLTIYIHNHVVAAKSFFTS